MNVSAFLVLDSLTKRFGGQPAVDRVSLGVDQGEILALLGPSGSGKTTTLRLLAGFETPDAGRIVVGGEDVTTAPAAARRFGMVFQHYALFPHLDVGENVGFGLESRRVRPPERERRVREALALVDLTGFERRRVEELSGGQQQRVALARALAPEPRVLLLDEPLSNLDPTLRERTRRELRALIRRIGITTLLVTHEQEEAFDLADRIALLRAGALEQVGTAEELYGAPASPFVATFVGRSSVVPVERVGGEVGPDGFAPVRLAGTDTVLSLPLPERATPPLALYIRPEALRFDRQAGAGQGIEGVVTERRYAGAVAIYTVGLGVGEEHPVEVLAEPAVVRVGDHVHLTPTGRGLHLFAAGTP